MHYPHSIVCPIVSIVYIVQYDCFPPALTLANRISFYTVLPWGITGLHLGIKHVGQDARIYM